MTPTKEELLHVQKVLEVVLNWSGETPETDGEYTVLEAVDGSSFTLDDLTSAMYTVDQLIKQK